MQYPLGFLRTGTFRLLIHSHAPHRYKQSQRLQLKWLKFLDSHKYSSCLITAERRKQIKNVTFSVRCSNTTHLPWGSISLILYFHKNFCCLWTPFSYVTSCAQTIYVIYTVPSRWVHSTPSKKWFKYKSVLWCNCSVVVFQWNNHFVGFRVERSQESRVVIGKIRY